MAENIAAQPDESAAAETDAAAGAAAALASDDSDAGKTALDDVDGAAGAVPVDWPEDWRSKVGGDDDKAVTRLGRFASPKALWESFTSLEKKLNDRGSTEPFPGEGTEAEQSVWRERNGLPAKPEGYTMPEGLVLGDADKPIIDAFLEVAHGMNKSPAAVHADLNWYFKMREDGVAANQAQDDTEKLACQKELRTEMGAKTNANMNAIVSLLDKAPTGVKDNIMGARLADGTALGNNPAALRWLVATALEIDPTASSVDGEAGSMENMLEEIASMEKLMADRSSEYYAGPKAEDGEVIMQKRYRELIEVRDKVRVRDKKR
jgi:hypothetical protein